MSSIDYKKQDFARELRDYDVVLNSLGGDVLEKSLQILKPGGHLISISGPPTPTFAVEQRLSWPLTQVLRLLSRGIRKKSKRHRVSYTFVFMRAEGKQLEQITSLIESGAIKPVVDRIFPFQATAEAIAYVESGRSKGKVVVKIL
jgi:NADPH:quinone reductase-like Zn-dependent oxidoreductase